MSPLSLISSHLPVALQQQLASLPSWVPLVHELAGSKAHAYAYATAGTGWRGLVDLSEPSLWVALGMVFFNPIYWNLVARNEYHNKTLTKTFGSPYLGCYFLAVTIFSLGIVRDVLFERALRLQPAHPLLAHPLAQTAGYALIALGQLFVITSIYALGITGTYLGDYFGILMSHRVTGFPFNVLNDPMYVGSTLAFLGGAIVYQSPVGVAIAGLVWIVYAVALKYEGPFTDKIYSASHKKSTTSAPSTQRKSSRIANKRSSEGLSTSYAAAAAKTPAPDADGLATDAPPAAEGEHDALPAQTPRARRTRQSVAPGTEGRTPGRMTRSRSKGRLGSETDQE